MNRLHPRFRSEATAEILGRRAVVAAGVRTRLLGLALIDRFEAPEALLIPGCRSVHTFGMRFEIEVAFLDGGGSVVERHTRVRAQRIVSCRAADSVLEWPCCRAEV